MWLVKQEMADVPGKGHEDTAAGWGALGGTVQTACELGENLGGSAQVMRVLGKSGGGLLEYNMCSRRPGLGGTWGTYAGKSEIGSYGRICMQEDQNLTRMTCNLP